MSIHTMLKSISLTFVFVLCSFQLDLVSAQIINGQTEPLQNAKHVDNPTAVSGEIAVKTDRRSLSPQAIAEARKLYKEGLKYSRAGLFPQAAELFRRSVEFKPDYADAYKGLGDAYFDMGRWEEAIQSLQQVIALKPTDREARARVDRRIDQARLMMQNQTGGSEKAPQQPAGEQVSQRPPHLPPPLSNTRGASTDPAGLSAAAPANEMELTKIYHVGPGDVLAVITDLRLGQGPDVRSREPASPSTNSSLFTITPSGLLDHPSLTDPLPVAGLTVEEISARLEDNLKRRALSGNPRISVEVSDYVSHTILVSGLVKEPGTKILKREAIPLYVVVADAQPLPEAVGVSLVRNKSNEVYAVDLTNPAEMNRLVHPGDVITLRVSPTEFFYVSGEVGTPGERTFHRGLTLTQAIIAAGGLTGKPKEARLARDNGKGFLVGSRYKLKDIDSGKVADPLIQPGDRITIVK